MSAVLTHLNTSTNESATSVAHVGNPTIATEAAESDLSSSSLPNPVNVSLDFRNEAALSYFLSLNTTIRLLSDFHGDSTIYVSDDQPLDYNALNDIYFSTDNASALGLATQINKTMTNSYGSLYRYWNAVYVIFGVYPSAESWNVTGGTNEAVSTEGNYRILSTVFPPNNNTRVELNQYADLALYYAIWNVEADRAGGSLGTASSVFLSAQSFCSTNGCKDSANTGSASAYQSFKLALDLIAYKILLGAGAFTSVSPQVMGEVNASIDHMVLVANQLQAQNGGVYTQYSVNGGIVTPIGSGDAVAENGETTSLFAIASYLWNA